MKWLDEQPSRSVIYLSFGSLVGLSRTRLFEFWYGLVNSGKLLLWVIRPDSIGEDGDGDGDTSELEEGTKQRGLIMVPQEEVLGHGAVGWFLTVCGWNTTLESIHAGVPMICWPLVADQQVNSKRASDLWRIGFVLKDTRHRVIIEKMVRDLMEEKRERESSEINR